MESVIVLADFTPESRSALEYGYALATEKNLPVVLVYTYDVPILYTPDSFSGTFLPIEGAQDIAAENLKRLAAEYAARFPQVPTSSHLALSKPDVFLDQERRAANSLVIIGVNKENMNDWWEDHQDLDVLRESHYSVLAVQLGFVYRPVKSIMLALRPDQSVENFPLAQLQSILSFTGASLRVVTVNADKPLSAALQESLAPLGATYHPITTDSNDVDATLARLVLDNPTDWLAVVPGEYGFWAGLFHKSHTLALAEQSSVPLLTLHLEHKRK